MSAAALMASLHGPAIAAAQRELTPADAIATVRIMQNQVSPGHPITDDMISPDGRSYVLRLAHGDAERDGVWVDLWTGSLQSLTAASRPRRCAHLFTTGLGSLYEDQGANWDAQPANVLHWVNDHRIAFLWTDRRDVRQVVSLDLMRCQVQSLTKSPTSVYAFGVGAEGALLFDARVPRPANHSAQLWAQGFTLDPSADGWAVLRDDVDGGNISAATFDNTWFIQGQGAARPIEIAGRRLDPTNPSLRPVYMAPNARYAITEVGLATLPDEWHHYADSFLQSLFEVNKDEPNRIPLSYTVIDLRRGTSHPLWRAPMGWRTEVLWSPASNAVLLAPTFLPLTANDAAGLTGFAAAIVDVQTGEFERVPIDLTARTVTSMQWISPATIEIRSVDSNGADEKADRFQHSEAAWVPVTSSDTSPGALSGISSDTTTASTTTATTARPTAPSSASRNARDTAQFSRIHLEIRQSLNSPPQVWAIDAASGASRLVFDLNPHLQKIFKLGKVERITGTLPDGHAWLGQLIYPADYVPGRRYPLVIQSLYGKAFGPEEYTLDGTWGSSGMGLGPSAYPSYPGQLLATRNIAVLQFEVLHTSDGVKEPEERQLGFETVAEQLSDSGLIDRAKIALVGFSRNGYWVEYTLAHSHFPFATAIAADNYDPSYFQSALTNWRVQDAEMNGAPAYGTGLQEWLQRAPGFNAEHIHTPLRLMGQVMGGIPYLIASWEIYSRLRHLGKPVEISVMPGINRHPSHNTQNPRQIMSIQESAVDWLSFWLTGREDSNPAKHAEYARWQAMRDRQASNATPSLSATPKP